MPQRRPMTDAQIRTDDQRRAAIAAEAQARANKTGAAQRVRHRFGTYIIEPASAGGQADCTGSFVSIFQPEPAEPCKGPHAMRFDVKTGQTRCKWCGQTPDDPAQPCHALAEVMQALKAQQP